MKKLLKILLFTAAGLVAFVLLLAGATQTQFFRDRLRDAALSNLDSLLTADVWLGDLNGNLVTGFTIDGILMTVDGQPLLRADRIDLRYNLFEIPGKKISISALTLVRPRIRLEKGVTGGWNFQRMVRPRPQGAAGAGTFDWVIELNRLAILDGSVAVIDSAALEASDPRAADTSFIDYHRIAIDSINLVTSAKIAPEEKRAVISSLAFVSHRPEFRLEQLSGDLDVLEGEARVTDLVISTNRSDLKLSASVKGIDLLHGVSLAGMRKAPVSVALHAPRFDFGEMREFLPPISFMNGPVSMDMTAAGEFGDLKVTRMDLRFGGTQMHLTGTVANLHDPGKLRLDVKIPDSKINPADALALLPGLNLPDYSSVGEANLKIEYSGTPLDFHTRAMLETRAGNVTTDLALTIGGPAVLKYKGAASFRDVNLAEIFDAPGLASRLTGSATIEGEGVRFDRLATTAAVLVDSSDFRGLPLRRSRVNATVTDRILNGTVDVRWGSMHSTVTVGMDDRNAAAPAFSVDGDMSSLNLQDIFRDSAYASDLTMTLKAGGTGSSLDNVSGNLVVDLTNSRYNDYEVTKGKVSLALDQSDTLHKHLRLESNLADFGMDGAFNLRYLASLIPYEVQNIRESLGEKFAVIDSSLAGTAGLPAHRALGEKLAATPIPLNASYELHIKDLEPLSMAAGDRSFSGTGVLKGSMSGTYNDLALRNDLALEYFSYGTVESGLLIQDGHAELTIAHLRPTKALTDVDLSLTGAVRSLHLNRAELDSVDLSLLYGREQATYRAQAVCNRDYQVQLGGKARVTEDAVSFSLSRLALGYRDFRWAADTGVALRFTGRSAAISDLILRRDTESVAVRFSVGAGGALSATIEGSRIGLDALKYVMAREERGRGRRAFGGEGSFALTASGTLDDPVYHCTLRADRLSFRGVAVGDVHATLGYGSRALAIEAEILRPGQKEADQRQLSASGTIPLDLALRAGSDGISDRPMDLTVRSDGLPMSIFDPLLPTFNDLTGLLKCDLRIRGTPRSPEYDGSITISNCSFLFVPNNIYYTCEGTFEPKGERIRVVDATIRNVPSDVSGGRTGRVKLTGDFALLEFKPTDFNLVATGDLLVVKESTRKSELSVYGDLFVTIGSGGLHFTGSIENSLLKGPLVISNSSLIFPPTRATTLKRSAFSVPVVYVDDTTRAPAAGEQSVIARYFGGPTGPQGDEGTRTGERSSSFMDGLRYDLQIETAGGNNQIRMVFNPATSEELAAYIEGKFTIAGDGTQWFGEISIDRAYYNFLKRFTAEGSMTWTGDLLNPELNIKAQYTGSRVVHDSTGERTEQVVVTFKITGTRMEPKPEISMTIDGADYNTYQGPKSNDVQSDAIQYILGGNFPLTTAQKNDVAADIRTSVGSSLLTGATSLLTGTLSEFLRKETGFISSLELSYGSGATFGESADIRLSGVAFEGVWRYGGKILEDPLSNANFSLMYSLGTIFNERSLRNLMIELERRVESTTLGQTTDLKRVSSARLFYRISF